MSASKNDSTEFIVTTNKEHEEWFRRMFVPECELDLKCLWAWQEQERRKRAAIAALEAERDALRADAARYRHMRSSFARDIKHRLTWYLPAMTPMTADGLDSAIDAAIAAKEPQS